MKHTTNMDEQQVRQIIRDELQYLIRNDKYVFSKLIEMADGVSIQAGRTLGLRICTETDQKLGFFGKTPISRPAATVLSGGGSTVDSQSRDAINSIISTLTSLGLTS